MKVHIENLKFEAILGILPFERANEQLIVVDRLDRWEMDLFGIEGVDAHEPSILDSAVA